MSSKSETISRIYRVPLRRALEASRHRRTKRAMNMLKEFAMKNMKSSEVKVDPDVSEKLWAYGIENPPRFVTVKMEKDENGAVTVSLPSED